MKKKLISVLASIMILSAGSTSMALTASADTGVAFEVAKISTAGTITDGKLAQEEIVKVPVTITENKGVTAFLLEFTQDSNIEILAAKNKNSDYTDVGTFTWNVNALCLLWSENSCLDSVECGTVVELEVKVPAGTPVGTYEIGFNESEIQVTNTTFDSIEYTLTSGYVQVGGDSANNPVVETQAPVVTEAPPAATQAPATQAPVKATQPPARATAPAAAEETTTTTVATTSTANSAVDATTAVSAPVNTVTENTAVSGTGSGNIVTGNADSVQANETTTTASDKKNSSASNNSSKSSSSSANKTSDSPSTGVNGVVVPAVLLAVSTLGVIIASKKKNK